jgi:hypothetical protein
LDVDGVLGEFLTSRDIGEFFTSARSANGQRAGRGHRKARGRFVATTLRPNVLESGSAREVECKDMRDRPRDCDLLLVLIAIAAGLPGCPGDGDVEAGTSSETTAEASPVSTAPDDATTDASTSSDTSSTSETTSDSESSEGTGGGGCDLSDLPDLEISPLCEQYGAHALECGGSPFFSWLDDCDELPDRADDMCEFFLGYAEYVIGIECRDAYEEVFACLNRLDCNELPRPEPCALEQATAEAMCLGAVVDDSGPF